jgi:iron(III) transport system ATP-binding protein
LSHVEVEAAVKKYGSFQALNKVSLDIPSGAFFTLLGPSGCGKTTLLRALAGFHDIDSGNLRIDGVSIRQLSPHQRNIGMVFQDYAVFPHLSVEDNVGFGLKRLRLPQKEFQQRMMDILQVVQLETLRERMPHELSGGQQQRVGLARSLIMSPKVILMDEPLSNLDAQLREELRSEIRKIQKQLGITTIYVTHDQEEALAVSDLICVLHEGQVQQAGSPLEIYQNPANSFVASFVGGNNFIEVSKLSSQVSGQKLPEVFQKKEALNWVASIRPEQIELDPTQLSENDLQLAVELEEVNFLGREYHLTVNTSENFLLKIIIPAGEQFSPLQTKQEHQISFDWRALKFFDPAAQGRRTLVD